MSPEQIDQLQREVSDGDAAKRAYNGYIKRFCEQKRQSLFMAFSNLPLTAESELMETKRMLYAIDTLENEICSEIDTGKMADVALTKHEDEKKS